MSDADTVRGMGLIPNQKGLTLASLTASNKLVYAKQPCDEWQ